MKTICTIDEAAAKLKKSKRTVHNYARRGLLRKSLEDGISGVLKEDVETMILDASYPAMNRENWVRMNAEFKRMKEQMLVLTLAAGFNIRPIRDAGFAGGIFAAAKKALTSSPWKDAEIDLWLNQFKSIDETALKLVMQTSPTANPWVPFFELCRSMLDQVGDEFSRHPTLDMERRFHLLEDARKHLRAIAVVWTESGMGNANNDILRMTETDQEAVLNRLSGKT
jgi:hypothetical protein